MLLQDDQRCCGLVVERQEVAGLVPAGPGFAGYEPVFAQGVAVVFAQIDRDIETTEFVSVVELGKKWMRIPADRYRSVTGVVERDFGAYGAADQRQMAFEPESEVAELLLGAQGYRCVGAGEIPVAKFRDRIGLQIAAADANDQSLTVACLLL